jgi:signal peptidase I
MSKRKSWILLGSIVAVIAGLLLVRAFVLDYYELPQNGMYPGLPADSLLFGYKLAYSNSSDVQRGDIVIFKGDVKGQSDTYIWRVVGLPGETVETAGESLIIDGQPAKRERVREEPDGVIFREKIKGAEYEICLKRQNRDEVPEAAVTIPPEHFFVMGDNRFRAADSRSFGPIPFSAIVARKL